MNDHKRKDQKGQGLASRSLTARQVEVVLIVVEFCTIVMGSLLAEVSRRAKIDGAEWSYDPTRVLVSGETWRSGLWTLRQVTSQPTSQDSFDIA